MIAFSSSVSLMIILSGILMMPDRTEKSPHRFTHDGATVGAEFNYLPLYALKRSHVSLNLSKPYMDE